jgi:hypothetical protein
VKDELPYGPTTHEPRPVLPSSVAGSATTSGSNLSDAAT